MSEKNKKKKLSLSYSPDGEEKLIPDEDEEFEREAAERYRTEIENEEDALKAAEKQAEQQKRDYEQKLRQEKIAMMKAKQGIGEDKANEDSEADEETSETSKMSPKKKIENFWYHYKWPTIIAAVAIIFFGYMIYDLITKVEPDIMIIVTADNGLSYRADAVQTLFEKYAEDTNGDGKVYVEVIYTPMNPEGGADNYTQGNETKLYANLSSAQCVLYLTDDDSCFSLDQVLFDDLSDDFDSEYATTDGISLDSDMIKESIGWAQMPDDMVLMIRTPIKTLASSADDMRKTHDDAMVFISNLVSALDKYDNAS